MNHDEIDVTSDVTIAPGGRAEHARVDRRRLPRTDLGTHASPELDTQVGEDVGRGRRNVIPIELMHSVTAHLHRLDDPLFDKSSQASTNTDLRTTCRLGSYLADR